MSGSPPQQEDPSDLLQKAADELDEHGAQTEPAPTDPESSELPKRGRGRPKGSKNKKPSAATIAAAQGGSADDAPKKKRGRPPKKRPEEDGSEPPLKRKRGRPPKNPKPDTGDEDGEEGNADVGESSSAPKRKRGRPRKDSAQEQE